MKSVFQFVVITAMICLAEVVFKPVYIPYYPLKPDEDQRSVLVE